MKLKLCDILIGIFFIVIGILLCGVTFFNVDVHIFFIAFDFIKKAALPLVFIIIGIYILSGKHSGRNDFSNRKIIGNNSYFAIFNSLNQKADNMIFGGCSIDSIFGSVNLDLRNAIITEDVTINSCVVFAGACVYLPENVNVVVSSIPIFGGVSNKTSAKENSPTVYIKSLCMFGGLDIK